MAPDRDELRDPLECTTWIVDKLRHTRYNKVAAYLTEHTVGLALHISNNLYPDYIARRLSVSLNLRRISFAISVSRLPGISTELSALLRLLFTFLRRT